MRNKLYRKLILLVLLLCFCFPTAVFASETEQRESFEIVYFDEIQDYDGTLRYTLIYQLGVGLSFNGRTALIYAECQTYDNANITLVTELQRNDNGNWKTIKTYTDTASNKKLCYCDETYAVTAGYEYRVKTTATVQVGNSTETATMTGLGYIAYGLEL